MFSTPPAAAPPRASRSNFFALERGRRATLIARATTNADGRTDAPLISRDGGARRQLRARLPCRRLFPPHAAPPIADPPFLDVVPIRFSIADPEAHYHVPLVVTPWSYSTYRGS